MRILVVEDEPSIREVEAAYLRHAGYEPVEIDNGQEAMDMFDRGGFDLAIIDINIPGADGLAVCRHIRARSTVPVVIVTAKDGDNDELKGLEAGADDYVKKPFNPNILLARVQNLLRRHGHGQITVGDLVIDPQGMTVRKQGTSISMTVTQFNILQALAARPGVVLTRGQLIDAVYDDPAGHDIYDRTIDAHIKSIRKLIEDDPARPRYIRTIIGRGYCFRDTS
jgi:two-component system response regulator RegX3